MTALPIIIVGGGLCGMSAAGALRAGGYDGEVVIVGEEIHPPYSRPPLSKELMRGEVGLEKVYLRPQSWYERQAVGLRLGVKVVSLDPGAHTIDLADGERLGYEKVLLATGGVPRTVDVPGGDLPGVVTLRTIADAQAVGEHLVPDAPIVVVGAGFIGAEVAASARSHGCDVTILEIASVPLLRVCGPELGAVYADIHREHGVKLLTGVGLARIEQHGTMLRVFGTNGQGYDASAVLIGVGLNPEVGLAEHAGLELGNGIVVNEFCETSAPDVYAAGDIAFHPNPILGRHMRLEHWQNAQHQGIAAAKTMLGKREPFSEVPWVWSDQFEYNLQMVGYPEPTDQVIVRGDREARDVVGFFLRDDRLVAAIGINRAAEVRAARRLIHNGFLPDARQLLDEDIDLGDLAAALDAGVLDGFQNV